MDGVPVYEARLNMGQKLARKILAQNPSHDIDVVIPIPDTARTSALQCAYDLNVPFREGFIKNRYIARTFIMPVSVARDLAKGYDALCVQTTLCPHPFLGSLLRGLFICQGQETRRKSVRLKLNFIRSEFFGRNVLLVDDSIGTTAVGLGGVGGRGLH